MLNKKFYILMTTAKILKAIEAIEVNNDNEKEREKEFKSSEKTSEDLAAELFAQIKKANDLEAILEVKKLFESDAYYLNLGDKY
jgi:hypothetical protein